MFCGGFQLFVSRRTTDSKRSLSVTLWSRLTNPSVSYRTKIPIAIITIRNIVGHEHSVCIRWAPVIDLMLHGKPLQFLLYMPDMLEIAPLRYSPGCIVPVALESTEWDVKVALFIYSTACLSIYCRIYPTEYMLKFMFLHNLATSTSGKRI